MVPCCGAVQHVQAAKHAHDCLPCTRIRQGTGGVRCVTVWLWVDSCRCHGYRRSTWTTFSTHSAQGCRTCCIFHCWMLHGACCTLQPVAWPAVGDGAAVQRPRQEDDAQRVPHVRPLGPLLAVVSTLLLSEYYPVNSMLSCACCAHCCPFRDISYSDYHNWYYFHDRGSLTTRIDATGRRACPLARVRGHSAHWPNRAAGPAPPHIPTVPQR